jgi:hypothetical protein
MPKTELKALGEKAEHIEYGRFAAAIGSEKGCERSEIVELKRSECPVVFHAEVLDPRRLTGQELVVGCGLRRHQEPP